MYGQIGHHRGLVELALVDVDHDLVGVGREASEIVTHEAERQAAPDRQEQVAVLHGEVGGTVAVASRVPDEYRVVEADQVHSQPRSEHRNAGGVGEVEQVIDGAGNAYSGSCDDARPLGAEQRVL